jgi:hypothetical protein
MINLKPEDRITIPQILASKWMKELNSDSESDDEEEQKGDKEENGEQGENNSQGDDEIDFKEISGNINYVNVDNLFYSENYRTKLSYSNYCCITEDFTTKQLDEESIKATVNCGFPREFLLQSLTDGSINHATATYVLLTS